MIAEARRPGGGSASVALGVTTGSPVQAHVLATAPIHSDRLQPTPARWRSIPRRSSTSKTPSGLYPAPCWRASPWLSASGFRGPTPSSPSRIGSARSVTTIGLGSGHPVLHMQARHLGKLAGVVGDQRCLLAESVGGDHGVQRANRGAAAFAVRHLVDPLP